jgi:hypothetical protein
MDLVDNIDSAKKNKAEEVKNEEENDAEGEKAREEHKDTANDKEEGDQQPVVAVVEEETKAGEAEPQKQEEPK